MSERVELRAERPHVALVVVSGFLSNPAKDYLRSYEENNRPPFRIKFWERPIIDKLTRGNRELLDRFLLGGMRSHSEIIAAEQEFFDRIWYERHLVGRMKHESGESRMTDGIYGMALEAAERVKGRRPDLRPTEGDFEWGMWNGKLRASLGPRRRVGLPRHMTRDLIEALSSNPVTIAEAGRAEKDGGIPDKPGLYAWWLVSPDALSAVPAPRHASQPGLRLVYVGVAPKYAESRETLRSRALKKHVGPGLAGSTFRRSLAALLWEERGWTPLLTETGRFKLSPDDDAALRAWQERNLRLSWREVARPWESEPLAIHELEPPFNLAGNRDHPFYETMKNARAFFKLTAEALARRPA